MIDKERGTREAGGRAERGEARRKGIKDAARLAPSVGVLCVLP